MRAVVTAERVFWVRISAIPDCGGMGCSALDNLVTGVDDNIAHLQKHPRFAAHEQMFPITLTLPGRSNYVLSTASTVLVWGPRHVGADRGPPCGLAKGT